MKPSEIVARLGQHVIGQDDAKRVLAVAVYAHFRKAEMAAADRLEMLKSNVLLIGPTGSGKTLLCETLAQGRGGSLTAANRPNGGAVFTLRLPLTKDAT